MNISSYSLSSSSESIEQLQELANNPKTENKAPIVCNDATEWFQELEINPESNLVFKSNRRSNDNNAPVTVNVAPQSRRIVSSAIQTAVTELFPSSISSASLIIKDQKK